MSPARARILVFGLAVGVAMLGTVTGAHQWGVTHVDHYTGTTGWSPDCIACHVYARGGTLLDRIEKPVYLSPCLLQSVPMAPPSMPPQRTPVFCS